MQARLRLNATAPLGCLAACSLALAACGSAAMPAVAADLHARALDLPAVQPGAPCPESPRAVVPAGATGASPTHALGTGPAYLSGQAVWYAGAPGQAAAVLVSTRYRGPILIRARSLDGEGTIAMVPDDLPASRRPAGMTEPGTTTADGVDVRVGPPARPGLWSDWPGRLTASAPGCDAVQVDGTGFTSVIVFAVQPEPHPGE
jgi:hypothetical protein